MLIYDKATGAEAGAVVTCHTGDPLTTIYITVAQAATKTLA